MIPLIVENGFDADLSDEFIRAAPQYRGGTLDRDYVPEVKTTPIDQNVDTFIHDVHPIAPTRFPDPISIHPIETPVAPVSEERAIARTPQIPTPGDSSATGTEPAFTGSQIAGLSLNGIAVLVIVFALYYFLGK